MSDIILFTILSIFIIAWIITELRVSPSWLRLTLAGLLMIVLISGIFSAHQRNHIHNQWNAQVINQIHQFLQDDDIKAANNLIEIYKSKSQYHPAFNARHSINNHE